MKQVEKTVFISYRLEDFDEAIRLKPDDAAAYCNRALLRESKGRYLAAVTDFQKYLDLGGGVRSLLSACATAAWETTQVKIEHAPQALHPAQRCSAWPWRGLLIEAPQA